MQRPPSHTAILIFARTARAEAAGKSFVRGRDPRFNQRIAASLNKRIQSISRQTGLPVFCISEQQQVGTTFGERFTHALRQVFAAGYERVISVGNDCLTLNTATLRQAAEHLQSHAAVLGPATDGGLYLLGLDRETFGAGGFEQLPWQQETLYDEVLQLLAGAPAALLPPQSDVDNASQFQTAIRRMRQLPLWLRLLLARLHRALAVLEQRTFQWFHVSLRMVSLYRGPPIME